MKSAPSYFDYAAAKAGVPAKTAPVKVTKGLRSEYSANRAMVRK